MTGSRGRIVCLTGGVGGAKLVLGLQLAANPANVTAIVNTGDDFRHLGLHVSPDIDTLLYTLSGKAHAVQGWGRADESWAFMATLREFDGEDWFQLGDRDLAIHVLRTAAMLEGSGLTTITDKFARRLGIGIRILPASDDRVSTVMETDVGRLAFQQYFVKWRCQPSVKAIHFEGADSAKPAPGVIEAIMAADVVLIAPSNPFLSVDPILSVAGIRSALAATPAPVVATSPLIGGRAVKGPTAKLMTELDIPVTNESIALHYAGIIDGLLIDERDRCIAPDIVVGRASILMRSAADRISVANAALDLAGKIPG